MGGSLSKLGDYCSPQSVGRNVRAIVGRKRKRHEDEENSSEEELQIALQTPKRKKLTTTSQYIYQTLFNEGKNSDITIYALDRPWKLHRVYLCQSPYFSSMFSGSWKETTEDPIHIEIADPNITESSLNTVLGSLYQDEIVLDPREVVATLAASTLFQLEAIIEKCAETMVETLNTETAVAYYYAGCEYGLTTVREAAFGWLLVNLLGHIQQHPAKLRLIDVELMVKLVSHPDLFVMQTEFSLYVFLRFWVFLQFDPEWDCHPKEGIIKAQLYFQGREDDTVFLLSKEGSKYTPTFQALRLCHMINHHLDVEMLKADRIIPYDWLYAVIDRNWNQVLRIDQGLDRGPRTMSYEEFSKDCLRCGRILLCEGEHVWRWTGYNFGLDLVWSCDTRRLKVRRSHRSEQELMLSTQQRRHFMVRVTLATLDKQKQIKHTQCTGMKTLCLYKNEEVPVVVFEKELKFPLLLSVNITTTTPFSWSPHQLISDIIDDFHEN